VTRVLFIDDEPAVLRSLDRALRVRKVPWEARFADSGQAGLDLLAAEPFDVVIADLRIPDLDGVELLTEVQRAYPRIARLVLSGQVGTDDCLRAMRVAHQCLAKPCNIEMLRATVQRIAITQSILDDTTLATAAAELSCLPSPPRVHFEVCAAIGREAGLPEIARIIGDDLALTAKLIQIVSSAVFAQGTAVSTVQRALSVLGTDVVRGLLLGAEVFRAFDGGNAKQTEALQKHSTFVAHLARSLAPEDLAGDAFVAGMLHDVGELVLAALGRTPEAVSDHARAGGYLLGLWGLGEQVVEAVLHHHDPSAVPESRARLVDLVHVAEIVAGELAGEAAQRDDIEVVSLDWLGRNSPVVLERARTLGRELWGKLP
jgi:HD-like signal output (HDOD) protein/CheY-like chemotaxis protein